MLEVQIDKRELERFIDKLDGAPEAIREAKRRAFEAAAPKLKAAVDSQIGGTGKVRGWQWGVVGSKGGYAAVRPKPDTYDKSGYAVGYVTNAINNGHRVPQIYTLGEDRSYKHKGKGPEFYKGRVEGKFFYQAAEAQASQVAQEAAKEILQAVKQHLEG